MTNNKPRKSPFLQMPLWPSFKFPVKPFHRHSRATALAEGASKFVSYGLYSWPDVPAILFLQISSRSARILFEHAPSSNLQSMLWSPAISSATWSQSPHFSLSNGTDTTICDRGPSPSTLMLVQILGCFGKIIILTVLCWQCWSVG